MSGNESIQSPSTSALLEAPKSSTGQRKHPCLLCQQRKVRCDRNEPCSNCVKAGVTKCEAAPQYPPRKRKKRFPEAELLARLRRYERHLRSYGADIEAINREALVPDTQEASLVEPRPTEPENHDIVNPLVVRRSLRHVENNLWDDMNREFRAAEEILQGSSEDEMYESPISKTYDAMDNYGDVVFGSSAADSLDLIHPSPVNIFRLWQTFLDNVNSLIKIFHAPSMQQQLLEATSNLDQVPKNLEALMFGIYSMAAASIAEADCEKLFDEDKLVMLRRYQSGARKALQNAGYLRSTDFVVLQAFVLLLLSSFQMTDDPRSLFCLSGIAVRMGQRMGLATDGTHYGLLPFEAEMRRRLWWQIVLIDTRLSEISGSGPGFLSYTWNTKLPLNFNDSDLFPDMRASPIERSGLTEISFFRLRCEIADFIQKSKDSRSTIQTATLHKAIDEFEQRIEREYLSYCDPSIPLHFMSISMVRSAFCKLRIGRRHFQIAANRDINVSQAEKDELFILSITMLENHNLLMANPLARRYIWHAYTNFPFPAYLYLVCALRQKTTGDLVDRAWKAVAENIAHRENGRSQRSQRSKESTLYFAIGSLAVKAWEAHEAAVQNTLPTPRFISQLRQKLLLRKRQPSMSGGGTPSVEKPAEELAGNQFTGQYMWFGNNSAPIEQTYGQPMFPPTGSSPHDWAFWNGMMQGMGPMVTNDMDDNMAYFS